MRNMLAILAAAFACQAAQFTKSPEVRYSVASSSWNIEFTVDSAVDVTVEVLKQGIVIRHLASGVLGSNAPAPFRADSLHQILTWDGRDDWNQAIADTTGLAFRIRMGLSMRFDRKVFRDNNPIPSFSAWDVLGLSVDSARNLYVITVPDAPKKRSSGRLTVYTPGGRYLRTLLPFPADMDSSKLPGVAFTSALPNRLNPASHGLIQEALAPYLLSPTPMTLDMNSRGQMVMASGYNGYYTSFRSRTISFINTKGEAALGPMYNYGGPPHFAFVPGEDSLYISGAGLFSQYYYEDRNDSSMILKCGLAPTSVPRVFAGVKGEKGADSARFNQPRGIAVGPGGKVFIADYNNSRIQVFHPSGAYEGSLRVAGKPFGVKVHPRTGRIYTTTFDSARSTIFLRGYDYPGDTVAEVSRLVITNTNLSNAGTGIGLYQYKGMVMALDPYGDSAVIYLGACLHDSYPWAVQRCAEAGTSFAVTEPQDLLRSNPGMLFILTADPYNDQVIVGEKQWSYNNVKSWVLNGQSNAWTSFYGKYEDHRMHWAPDGRYYQTLLSGAATQIPSYVVRKSGTGDTVAFSGTGKRSEGGSCFNDRFVMKGNVSVGYDGRITVLEHVNRVGDSCQVTCYDSTGARCPTPIVTNLPHAICIKADRSGNIFFAANLKTPGTTLPEEIRSAPWLTQLPRAQSSAGSFGSLAAAAYGSVLKFGPEGGTARQVENTTTALAQGEVRMDQYLGRTGGTMYDNDRFAVKGLKASFLGMSPVLPNRYTYPGSGDCNCFNPMFDLDPFGRLWVPDAVGHRVTVLDNNMNVITRFGEYDNFDNPGGAAAGNRPPLPLEYPHHVAYTDKAVYVTNYGTRYHDDYSHSYGLLRTVPRYAQEVVLGDTTALATDQGLGANGGTALFVSPNPSNPMTRLVVNLPVNRAGNRYELSVYDLSGRLVRMLKRGTVPITGLEEAVVWDGNDGRGRSAASGRYIARLVCGKGQTRMLVTRLK